MVNYDVIVIGGGPGGYVCAIKAAQNGLKVACVDVRSRFGGTCLNVGCIPSKCLLNHAHNYHNAHSSVNNNFFSGELTPNWSKIMENKESVIAKFSGGIDGLLKKNKIEKIVGLASFVNSTTISVEGKEYTAKNFVIATGSKVASLPGVEVDEKTVVSSTGALDLKEIPKRLTVIGAGVIGLELGSVYRTFGSEVNVVEYSDRVLASMDKDISKEFKKIAESTGVKFHLQSKVTSVKDGIVEFESLKSGEKSTLESDIVLVATGRSPNTDSLGLDKAGITLHERGYINVNDKFETSASNVYAIGDVIHGPMLAHKAEEDGVAVANILAGKYAHVDYNLVPSVVYTSPEVASIGKTENELKDAGIEYKAGKFSMMANSRAGACGKSDGFAKILACAKTDKILGAHIIGEAAGELIHQVAAVMSFKGSSEDLSMICYAHPTLSECVKEAALATFSKAIHS